MWKINESPIETERLKKPVFRITQSEGAAVFGTPAILSKKDAEHVLRLPLGRGANFISLVASHTALSVFQDDGWQLVEESVGVERPAGALAVLPCEERKRERFSKFSGACFLPGEEAEAIESAIPQMQGWSKTFTGSYHRCGYFDKEVVDAVYEQWFFDTLRSKDAVKLLSSHGEEILAAHTMTWSGGVWKSGFSLTAPSKMSVGASSAAAFGQYPDCNRFFEHHAALSYMAVDNVSQQAFHQRMGYHMTHFRQVLFKAG
jgi:hypothetical protein